MKKFIKTFFLFVGYVLILTTGLLLFYILYFRVGINDLPAPNLSDSYSYNEKMQFLHKHKINAEILAVGSSMSLSNLSSDAITQRLNPMSYLNTASWAMTMKDDFDLLKILLELNTSHTKTIILASCALDFQNADKHVKLQVLRDYLSDYSSSQAAVHFKTFSLAYYISNFAFAKRVRTRRDTYDYLGFDGYGGVNFDSQGFEIGPERWNEDDLDLQFIPHGYDYLDSICACCKARNIQLLFFQCPFRQGLYTILSKKKINTLNGHINKVADIINKYNRVFVNAGNAAWDDSLFVDATHFNKKGAELFTNYCFNRINGKNTPPVNQIGKSTNLQPYVYRHY